MGPQPPIARERLHTLPKVELHLHLEGTITPAQAAGLAQRHGQDPAAVRAIERDGYPTRYRDFDHFLRTFLATSGQVRTPDDLYEVAAALARDRERQHIAYTEVTFTAATHLQAGMAPAAMWEALREGLATAPGTRIGLVVDVVRDDGPEAAERTVRVVEEAEAPIVGLGLSGIEGAAPEGAFTVLRTAADRLGLGLTVHAGETGTAANVRDAVVELGADRIGHGIAAAADPAVLRLLASTGVPLEVCPSSNVALGLVPTFAAHPLARLHEAGVTVTIGSDDPPFFATTLTEELEHAARLLAGDEGVLADLQVAAARASFAPRGVRAELVARVEDWRAGTGA